MEYLNFMYGEIVQTSDFNDSEMYEHGIVIFENMQTSYERVSSMDEKIRGDVDWIRQIEVLLQIRRSRELTGSEENQDGDKQADDDDKTIDRGTIGQSGLNVVCGFDLVSGIPIVSKKNMDVEFDDDLVDVGFGYTISVCCCIYF